MPHAIPLKVFKQKQCDVKERRRERRVFLDVLHTQSQKNWIYINQLSMAADSSESSYNWNHKNVLYYLLFHINFMKAIRSLVLFSSRVWMCSSGLCVRCACEAVRERDGFTVYICEIECTREKLLYFLRAYAWINCHFIAAWTRIL